ncbi:glutathione S-transferase family protein [Variovorax paradoxus]|uniref:glutathione S-transferase family protein n=1 Tax=Variovorax paradoxus TaxID=34073 RepID=UPI002480D041|nr:glutathione S-transferase family protein [Variovorax paradoxus]WGT62524.1 glutathione S-transferase family protein [Variovorax paradoxus]
MRKLYIGNKNYSSWSMRPWVLMKQAGIPFEEVKVRFDSFEANSQFKKTISTLNPVAKVPVLVDGDLVVWDTLAIAEYLAETFPEKQLWPRALADRARARSICAEMHSGFGNLRTLCGMNIEASLADVGAQLLKDNPGLQGEVDRIAQMWTDLLDAHGGPMLFGEFTNADAYFAPVGTRIKTYGLPVPPSISAYIERVQALPGIKAWIDDALAEKDFLRFEEPYRKGR